MQCSSCVIVLKEMGNVVCMGSGKISEPRAQPTMNDVIMELKLSAKKFDHQKKKAQKEEKDMVVKAKTALKKNDEEAAKMYLQTAASKHAHALAMQRISLKTDHLTTTIKSNNSHQTMVGNWKKIAQLLDANKPDNQSMVENYDKFEKAIDQITVNGKVTEEILHKNTHSDTMANNMLDDMKRTLALETEIEVANAAKIQDRRKKDNIFMGQLAQL